MNFAEGHSPLRVLVADDDPIACSLVVSVLVELGHGPEVASSGAEAGRCSRIPVRICDP
jgi:CheY-like chemotaxis protein